MERISFDNGDKRVEINDSGDYIVIPMGDNTFPQRVIEFSKKAEDQYNILLEKEKELHGSDVEIISNMRAGILLNVGQLFDGLFGDGSCKKVFGNLAPSMDIMVSFMEQIAPLVNKFATERQSEIEAKYVKRGRR